MSKKILITLLLTTLAGSGISNSPLIPAVAKTPAASIANTVYAKANPATITIRGNNGHGSAFIVDANGYVITNAHVVRGEPAVVTLMMADGKTEVPADVVGFGRNGHALGACHQLSQINCA